MFIFVMAIGLAAFRAEDAREPLQGSRGPASIGAARFGLAGLKRGPASKRPDLDVVSEPSRAHKHTEKLSGPLTTSIELVGSAPNPGDIFVLKGSVLGSSSLEDVSFKWILPEGVELVNGEQTGTVGAVTEGKPFEVQVTLRQLSPKNEQIHLQVLASQGPQKFGHTSQYNSLMEQALQTSRKELQKSTEDYDAQHSQKVMH